MIPVHFRIRMTDEDNPDAWLHPLETQMMLDHTRAQINAHVQKALGDLVCAEHDEQASVTITGTYDAATEQLEIGYDVQTCCRHFLMRCVAALNHR
jgi:hypothetical protein